jgi:hypothetical protein
VRSRHRVPDPCQGQILESGQNGMLPLAVPSRPARVTAIFMDEFDSAVIAALPLNSRLPGPVVPVRVLGDRLPERSGEHGQHRGRRSRQPRCRTDLSGRSGDLRRFPGSSCYRRRKPGRTQLHLVTTFRAPRPCGHRRRDVN